MDLVYKRYAVKAQNLELAYYSHVVIKYPLSAIYLSGYNDAMVLEKCRGIEFDRRYRV